MTIEKYILQQEIERQNIMYKIHFAILDARIKPLVLKLEK